MQNVNPILPVISQTNTLKQLHNLPRHAQNTNSQTFWKTAHFWHRLYRQLVLFDVLSREERVRAPALVVNQVSPYRPIGVLALNDSVGGSNDE